MKQDLKEIATILAAIADGAEWETHSRVNGTWWKTNDGDPLRCLLHGWKIRLKPRTITINGIDVPEPVRDHLKEGQGYWSPSTIDSEYRIYALWEGDKTDDLCLKRGLIHLTAEAAAAHGRALASFTERGQG